MAAPERHSGRWVPAPEARTARLVEAARRALARLWPPLAYLGLTLALTWPLAIHLGDTLPGVGDPQLLRWILAWDTHALATNPLRVFDAPIFFPYPDTLAYSDHLLPLALLTAPITRVTGDATPAFNLLLLSSFVAAGWGVYLLVRGTVGPGGGESRAAFIAGAGFAFSSFRYAHYGHLQMLQICWLPWALAFLQRLVRPVAQGGGRWRDAVLFGVTTALQCSSAVYSAFFAALVLGVYTLLWALRALWRRTRHGAPLPWRAFGLALLGGALAIALVGPLLLPYVHVYRTLGIVRSIRELDNWSAPLSAYLSVAPGNLLYGRLFPKRVGPGELVLFPGVIGSSLAGMALALRRPHRVDAPERTPVPARTFWLLVAILGLLLSFGTGVRVERGGPTWPVPLPYSALYQLMPGFAALRVPARWGVLVTLAVSVLAGIALARLLPRLRPGARAPLAALALAGVLAEHVVLPVPMVANTPAPPVYTWLGAQPDVSVVLELPVGRTPRGAEVQRIMQRQSYQPLHWKQLPVAFSGLIPFGMTDLLAQVQRLPDADTLRYLQLLGVDTLVIHTAEYQPTALRGLLAGLDSSGVASRAATLDGALVYAVHAPRDGALDIPPGATVYLSGDERAPGILVLALARRWHEQGAQLFGPRRVRYYGALRTPHPGQVFAYGLLAADEDPVPHGFATNDLRWRSNGLAFYAGDPALRADLELGRVPAGAFHPAYPAALTLRVGPTALQAGDRRVEWTQPLDRAWLELDVASLDAETLHMNERSVPLPPGRTTIALAAPLGQELALRAREGRVALLRCRVRATAPASSAPTPRPVLAATARFDGSRLVVQASVAATPALRLEVRGAAAYDDRPVRLVAGIQSVPPDGGVTFDVDLLDSRAPWVQARAAPVDGRYIAYLAAPLDRGGPGVPVAQFSIQKGRIVDPQAVPLPLAELR
jgi:hypothetical protein